MTAEWLTLWRSRVHVMLACDAGNDSVVTFHMLTEIWRFNLTSNRVQVHMLSDYAPTDLYLCNSDE